MTKRLITNRSGALHSRLGVAAAVLLALGAALAPHPAPAAGDPPVLGLPIQCSLGSDCWVVNLVDLDTSKGIRDYKCGKNSYDGHKGTDIAIRDLAAMREGVPVIASAAGIVFGVRDGMKDVSFRKVGTEYLKGRDCGNGVTLRHPDGWETQYCHLRSGSVSVVKGGRIKAGQQLGLVGHSGLSEFPHIHLSVRYRGKVVDPFVGVQRKSQCEAGKDSLWAIPLRAALGAGETAIYHSGFAAKAPKSEAIRAGLHNTKILPKDAPALVLWTDIFRIRKGDRLRLRLVDPEGSVIAKKDFVMPKVPVRHVVYLGKKKKALSWPVGRYRGEVTLTRGQEVDGRRTYKVIREVEIQ